MTMSALLRTALLCCLIQFGLGAISNEDEVDNLHDILPMAGETVTKMLDLLRRNAAVLGFLPKGAKVALAKEQLKRNQKDFDKFNALPKRTQERVLGKFLSTNLEARLAYEKNVDIIEALDLKADPKAVIALAKSQSSKYWV